ncbi:hypothetical protein [Rhodococcus sp. UFZ-B548]|uniref:hypothetical protein n=1 Tax=Rhodococcus sp. UFZ-B548 TaxID=2742212 RepID=UPI0015F6CACE|nr:hypothetical protein [Rhodococcus sp. UFZ-B548]
MTESPTVRAASPSARVSRSVTAGDVVILSIITCVFVGMAFLGGAVLWNELNPSKWTAGGWAAVGAWIAGIATFCAVLVALTDSAKARNRAWQSINAAEVRAEQALWAARRDREIGALTAFQLPVRAMCMKLTEIEAKLKWLVEIDGFVTAHPPPGISDQSAAILTELTEFKAIYQLNAYATVEGASIIVTVSSVKNIVDDMYEELNQLDVLIEDWRTILGAQGAPDLSTMNVSRAAIFLGQLDEVRIRIDDAYPILPPDIDDVTWMATHDATMGQ